MNLKKPSMLNSFLSVFLVSSTLVFASKVGAFPAEKGGDGWTVEFGLGGELEPQFAGADNRQLEPDPYINLAYRRGPTIYYTSIVDYGFYHTLNDRWLAGASLGLEVGRDEDDDEALSGLGKIDNTWELRLDLVYRLNEDWILAARAMTAGANKDNVYFIAALYDLPIATDNVELTLVTDLSWASGEHLTTEFGVNAEQAADSGYPVYLPESGIKSVGIGLSGKYWWSKNWFGFAEINYERYGDAGSDSPFADNDYDIESGFGIGFRF